MRIYRVENNKGHGPIYGTKRTEIIHYDHSDNQRYIDSCKRMAEMRGQELDQDLIVGSYENTISYDSRDVIIHHKTPRENKPYFHNRYDLGTFGYYRFGNKYSFGWKTLEQCKNFVEKGKKKKWILHREGFYITEYASNDFIIFPDGQVAFNIKRSKVMTKYRNIFV